MSLLEKTEKFMEKTGVDKAYVIIERSFGLPKNFKKFKENYLSESSLILGNEDERDIFHYPKDKIYIDKEDALKDCSYSLDTKTGMHDVYVAIDLLVEVDKSNLEFAKEDENMYLIPYDGNAEIPAMDDLIIAYYHYQGRTNELLEKNERFKENESAVLTAIKEDFSILQNTSEKLLSNPSFLEKALEEIYWNQVEWDLLEDTNFDKNKIIDFLPKEVNENMIYINKFKQDLLENDNTVTIKEQNPFAKKMESQDKGLVR